MTFTLRIVNKSRGSVLAEQAQEATRAFERLKGLLGRQALPASQALFIRPCNSIHSFFMRFVFDAVFVDREGKVLHVIHQMKPWRISKIVVSAQGVIELPSGTLASTNTCCGDQLVFERCESA